MTGLNEAQRLIFALLSPISGLTQQQLDRLDAGDWEEVDALAQLQRLKPMLHWMATTHHAGLVLPDAVLRDWQRTRQGSQMRSLANLGELLKTTTALEQAGIPCLALKGAYLAHFAYPEPNLRPMRDIDVIVPRKRLRDAYETLLRIGASRITKYGYDANLDASIEFDVKHLPSLLAPNGKVTIEVHNFLFNVEMAKFNARAPELSRDSGFWERSISREVAGRRLNFCSPEDLLIHLVVHAVYDHKFDNGPLLLSDIAFLLKGVAMDWDAFWATAERMDKVSACELALRLAERAWGDLGIVYHTNAGVAIGDALLDQAQGLMFYDISNKFGRNLSLSLNAQDTVFGKLKYLASRLFRPRLQIAATFNVDAKSPLVFLYYPLLYAILVSRYLKVMTRPEVRQADNPRAVAAIESIYAFLGDRRNGDAGGSVS